MRKIEYSNQFKRDYKSIAKRGFDIQRLERAITLLREDKPMPKEYRDHALSGNWQSYRECHLAFDWLLIYKKEAGALILTLMRTGTHDELL